MLQPEDPMDALHLPPWCRSPGALSVLGSKTTAGPDGEAPAVLLRLDLSILGRPVNRNNVSEQHLSLPSLVFQILLSCVSSLKCRTRLLNGF